MADSWPGSSYSYRDMESFCHHVFKQNVIPAIRLSFLAALSQPCKSPVTDRSPAACLSAVMRLCFFPRTSTFAWLRHTSLSIVLCVAARGRASLLFLVYECVHEVLCVWDRRIHFTYVHYHLLYLRGSPSFHAAQGAVCVHASISFILSKTKKNTCFVTISLACFPPQPAPLIQTVCYR